MGDADGRDAQERLRSLEHPCKGDVYGHCKGGDYRVLEVGIDADTLEPLVVYEDDRHPERGVWVRSLGNFSESVRLADGSTRPRFLLLA